MLLPSVTCEEESGRYGFLLWCRLGLSEIGGEAVCGAGLDLSKLLFLLCVYSVVIEIQGLVHARQALCTELSLQPAPIFLLK